MNGSDGDRQAAAAKLKALREQIIAGKLDFQEAVKKYSDCPSAATGGDIGYFPRKWAVAEPFAKTAFGMKVGDLSDVVHTEYGVHLIKVTDRKNGVPSAFEKIKDEVREHYVMEMRQGLIEQQRRAAKIEVNLP
jgi:parvulin-like peptidyl-prolyl isomerase